MLLLELVPNKDQATPAMSKVYRLHRLQSQAHPIWSIMRKSEVGQCRYFALRGMIGGLGTRRGTSADR